VETISNRESSPSDSVEDQVINLKLLITGGSGLLGSKLAEKAEKEDYEVYSGYNQHETRAGISVKMDVGDRDSVHTVFDKIKPEIVIHTAALTNVDLCEQDKILAWKVNVEGTRNIVELSRIHGFFIVYVSTDYVFSGEEGMYKEMDKTSPINYYGITKLEGEKTVMALTTEWCIARPSVIYGSTLATGKTNFALWVLDKLRKGEPIKVIRDQYVSPTLNTNLAEMILEVIKRRLTGIYHLAGASPINRYEFAQLVAETFNLDKDLIMPSNSSEMRWVANRPKNTSLNVEKASKTLDKKPLKIKEAINLLKEEAEKGQFSG
jgi:dTDP-4-dehydrorhamnose reductase